MGLFGPPNIKKLEEKGNIQELLKILGDGKMDKQIRVAAGSALGRLRVIEAIEPIIQLGTYCGYSVHEPLQDALLNIGAPAINRLIFHLGKWGSSKFVDDCLVRFGAQAVDPLIEVLKLDRKISEASSVLAKIGAPAFDAMVALLTNPQSNLRKYAAKILGKMNDVRAIQPLIASLNDSVPNVRENAIEALAAFHSVETVEAFVQCLNDAEPTVRKAAATALKSLGWKPSKDEAGANYWIALDDYAKCALIGAPAVEALVNIAKSRYYSDRINAIKVLAKIEDPRAFQVIIESLAPVENMSRSVNEEQHQAAIEALVQVGSPAVPLLLLALRHNNSTIRRHVITILGRIHDPRAIEPMVDLLLDESPPSENKLKEVLIGFGPNAVEPLAKAFGSAPSIGIQKRLTSVLSSLNWQPMDESTAITYSLLKSDFDRLAQMGEPAARQLVAMLYQPDDHINQGVYGHSNALVRALQEIGTPAVEPVLENLGTPDREVQMRLLEALDDIADSRAVEPLLHYLKSWQDDVLGEACLVLAKLGDPSAFEQLLSSYQRIPANYKSALIPFLSDFKHPLAVEFFMSVFDESIVTLDGLPFRERDARRAAADALAVQGDPRAIPVLLQNLAGSDLHLCSAVAHSLQALGWQPTTPADQVAYLIANNNFDGIFALGDFAVEPLVSFLLKRTYDLNTALKMVDSLRRLNKPGAIPAYLDSLKSADYSLRKAAAQALIEIYQSGQLSEQEKQMALAQRTVIQTKHEDQYISSDCSRHTDSGIGLSFPL